MSNIGFASNDWSKTITNDRGEPIMGGSGQIRIGQYLPYLKARYVVGSLVFSEKDGIFGVRTWDGEIHMDCPLIVMQRWMNRTLVDQIPVARSNGQVIAQDVDDWYWGISPSNYAFVVTHPAVNKEVNINHYRQIIGRSDYVIASTQYLADRLSTFINPKKIVLFENHVDTARFSKWEHYQRERPSIGWVGSTEHRSGDLGILRYPYSKLKDEFTFHHTGNFPGHKKFADEVGLPEGGISTSPFMGYDELVQEGFKFDIGVVPLVGIPFNNAKSWIKGIEYAAANIPFVASSSAQYIELKKRFGVGRVARRKNDWVKHLRALKDAKVREDEAAKHNELLVKLDARVGAEKYRLILASML